MSRMRFGLIDQTTQSGKLSAKMHPMREVFSNQDFITRIHHELVWVSYAPAPKTIGGFDDTVQGSSPDESRPRAPAKSQPVLSAGSDANAEASSQDRLPVDDQPNRLGGYRILRLLGRGAMGSVYEAKQMSLDRLVALKTIRGRLADNPSSLARFTREAYAAAQLTHHNVVQIYDFGEDDGRYFFSMEWVRGGALDELIREKGTLDPKLAAGYVLQAARGLQLRTVTGWSIAISNRQTCCLAMKVSSKLPI